MSSLPKLLGLGSMLGLTFCGGDMEPRQVDGGGGYVGAACPTAWSKLYDVEGVRRQLNATQSQAQALDAQDLFTRAPPIECEDLRVEYESLRVELASLREKIDSLEAAKALNSGAASVHFDLRWVVYEYECTADNIMTRSSGQTAFADIPPNWVTATILRYDSTFGNGNWLHGASSNNIFEGSKITYWCHKIGDKIRVVIGYDR